MAKVETKPRIALLGLGVLGGGSLGQGIPVLADLFDRLSNHYDIIYYSFKSIDTSQVPPALQVRQTVSLPLPGRLKYLLIMMRFAWDQVFNPVALIFAVSAYPTGQAAVILGRIFKRPVIVQFIALEAVALPDIGRGNLTQPWLRKITKWVGEKTDILVTVATYQKKIAQESLPTTREIAMLPLRIDYKKFTYVERTISFPVRFIHIAYYSLLKDQDTMFLAFSKVAKMIDCSLTVIGDGFDIPKVHTMLRELEITDKVTFTGVLKQSDIPEYLNDAHVLLHTARFETGCAVIQEAMASGVVVCGTEVGILSDIGDRYAVTVPPRDADQLAKKILQLVHDPELYRQKRIDAYQWISTYDAVWAARNYQCLISEKIAQSP